MMNAASSLTPIYIRTPWKDSRDWPWCRLWSIGWRKVFAIGVLIVLFVGIRRIRRYNRLIDSIYADNDDKRLYGITTILILMVLTGVVSFVANAVGRFVFLSSEIPFAVLACFFSGLLYLLCYRGFVQQFSFADIAQEECEETADHVPQESYSNLLQRIDDERLYLQPGLTLAELAQQLGTNRTMLSKLVNEETGMPFAEFINRKRIAYVRRLEKRILKRGKRNWPNRPVTHRCAPSTATISSTATPSNLSYGQKSTKFSK